MYQSVYHDETKKMIVLSSRKKNVFINKLKNYEIKDLEFYQHANEYKEYIKCFFRDTDNKTYYYPLCDTPYIHWTNGIKDKTLKVDNEIWKIIDSTMKIVEQEPYKIFYTKK